MPQPWRRNAASAAEGYSPALPALSHQLSDGHELQSLPAPRLKNVRQRRNAPLWIRDAVGAEVKLVTAHGQQFATVSTAGSYLSSGDKRVHFGLGSESAAQSIEIRWPSGITQTLKNVRADQILQVDEPSANSSSAAGTTPK